MPSSGVSEDSYSVLIHRDISLREVPFSVITPASLCQVDTQNHTVTMLTLNSQRVGSQGLGLKVCSITSAFWPGLSKPKAQPVVVAHACNPSTLGGRGWRISEFEASLVHRVSSRTIQRLYRETLSQKNQIHQTKKKKFSRCWTTCP